MDPEIKEKIEITVRQILQESDINVITESKVRKLASEKLDLNLSDPKYKAHVKLLINSFIEEQNSRGEEPYEEEQQQEEEDEEEEEVKNGNREYDDEGNPIICRLSDKRKVTVQEFRGKHLVSIREYYNKDGKELPSSKGISLTLEQWSALKKNIPAIQEAIEKMN